MKTFLLFILLAFQNVETPNFKILGSLTYCESQDIEYGNRKIDISKNGKIFKTVTTKFKGQFEITDLEPGDYVIAFTNIFGQRTRRNIQIENSDKDIALCVDDFEDTNVSTLLNTMKEDDKIVLSLSSHGCFHTFEEDLMFSLKNKNYLVTYTNKKGKTITNKLPLEKLNYLIRSEKIIRYLDKVDGGSTTTDGYSFTKNGKLIYSATDNTGSWHGYLKILKYLKLE